MNIAVISAQGDVSEHVNATKNALKKKGIKGKVVATMDSKEIESSDAIILPGGESTTISKMIHKNSIAEKIKSAADEKKPIMGTCAGSILLAKYGDLKIERTGTKLLELMDIKVRRNAFGRQKQSFQTMIYLKNIGLFDAVFIRAPAIIDADKNVTVLALLDSFIVAAQQNNILALSFHPELTKNTIVHEYFIEMGL